MYIQLVPASECPPFSVFLPWSCIVRPPFLATMMFTACEHLDLSCHNHMDTCLLIEGYNEVQCCACLTHNAWISIHLNSKYRAVQGLSNDNQQSTWKGQNCDNGRFWSFCISHCITLTNHSYYLWWLVWEINLSTLGDCSDGFVGSQGTFLVQHDACRDAGNSTNHAFSLQNVTKLVYSSTMCNRQECIIGDWMSYTVQT
jgi:hypothetical protein